MHNDWLSKLLDEWAIWWSNAEHGSYPSSTAIWRILHSPGDSGFESSLPKGVIPPAGLNKINLAMNQLLHSDCGEAVAVVRYLYLNGRERTTYDLKLSMTRFYTLKAPNKPYQSGVWKPIEPKARSYKDAVTK